MFHGKRRRPGGDEGNRSPNPRLAKAVLCQLSYVPGAPGGGSACGRGADRAGAAGGLVPQVGLGLAGGTLADRGDGAGDDRRENQLLEHPENLLAARSAFPTHVRLAPVAPAHGWAWEDLNLRPHPYQGCALTV